MVCNLKFIEIYGELYLYSLHVKFKSFEQTSSYYFKNNIFDKKRASYSGKQFTVYPQYDARFRNFLKIF